ncbi:MAG: multicopper oxidase domain-containing protein [Cyanobacteriota bacterium]|nr:multicopper oxidase domain-containing protein [Cyanobacteriota bacterium]
MIKLDRRKFLGLATVGVGATFAARWAFRTNDRSTAIPSSIALPQEHYSSDGLLELDLEAGYRAVDLAGTNAKLMTYNGQIPGPRLEIQPGDAIRLHFTNHLPQPTNLHYHGLHVPITTVTFSTTKISA